MSTTAATTTMMTRRTISSTAQNQHIFLLGATGGTGLAFIKHHLSLPDTPTNPKPHLTLLARPSSLKKLTPLLPKALTTATPTPKIRIISGSLSDPSTIHTALSADPAMSFPQVTTVISVLGSYISLRYFLTREKPTPLADALSQTVMPTMRKLGIRRILALSTVGAFPLQGEKQEMSWSWYLFNLFPMIIVPQCHAEMIGLGNAVLRNEGGVIREQEGIDGTVFRVPPVLTGKSEGLAVRTFERLGGRESESKEVSKGSLARWLWGEVEKGEWIGGAPVVVNPEPDANSKS